MKAILISLLVLAVTITKAEEISSARPSAPTTAQLSISGITRNMTTINPRFSLVSSGSITFNQKSLSLTLNKRMPPCEPGMMCIQVMPTPLNIKLYVTRIEVTQCSVKYIATTASNVKSGVSEVVTVEDFSYSKCERIALNSAGTVSYSVTGISSLTNQEETATANLLVDGEFVRAQN